MFFRFKVAAVIFVGLLAVASASESLDLPPGTKMETVAKLDGIIWGMDWMSSDTLIVSVKSGQFYRVQLPKSGAPKKAVPASVKPLGSLPKTMSFVEAGQGGLLDVKASPGFESDRKVYFTYSKKGGEGMTTALGQFHIDPKSEVLSRFKDLYVAKAWGDRRIHFGSRIAFGAPNELFLTVGDRGERFKAQDLSLDAGKVLRLRRDGSIPKDNPFVDEKKASPAVYSYGHRNPQGIYFDGPSKTLYVAEHGPRGGDEINTVRPGKNYGWPVITYGREYSGPKIGKGTHQEGMEQPNKSYVPSIAPSSLIRLSDKGVGGLSRHFVLGALVLQHLNTVSPDFKKETRFLTKRGSRIRSVLEGPDGSILASTDQGEILRIARPGKPK